MKNKKIDYSFRNMMQPQFLKSHVFLSSHPDFKLLNFIDHKITDQYVATTHDHCASMFMIVHHNRVPGTLFSCTHHTPVLEGSVMDYSSGATNLHTIPQLLNVYIRNDRHEFVINFLKFFNRKFIRHVFDIMDPTARVQFILDLDLIINKRLRNSLSTLLSPKQ